MKQTRPPKATAGDNEKELSEVFHRAAQINPQAFTLRPETQAKLDAYRAKRNAQSSNEFALVVIANVCTAQHPMPQVYRASDNWKHPDAKFHEQDGDFHDLHKCPNCGLIFCVEITNRKP